ncbi:thiamine-phosphate pyrophosphorylase [Nonlabens xylanidelens]|uniref:Thiamine-phosphate synthase n=1 Tax=Nonlabens xylanidelens TaxID=191564 RepID=A0A2S6IN34_9FLAO|nr:thiamine phosphate synthase [Nonlabens xylanidelens]PPK95550.1 thiamine-phosphate pyrophosphorylase [Nonlabens xylanidelens]PQJ22359.1 thiamine-phosphate diphosphorylase [Nonlabens xylanidelens]
MIDTLQYITQGNSPQDHIDNLFKACNYGIKWVQLRVKNTDDATVLNTAIKAREITNEYGVKLIINDHYKIAKEVQADGVHLGKTDACPLLAREYLGNDFIIGGTANTLEDCRVLLEKKVDYIGLGPYQFTETKKNLSPVLGVKGYRDILKELKTKTPIIAIGGIALNDVAAILKTGVYGIAVSGVITSNMSSIKEFQDILKATYLSE